MDISTNMKNVSFIAKNSEEDFTFFMVFIFGLLLPLSLFIILGNGLVIYSVFKYTYLREQAVFWFMRSLAFADCLVGIALVPIFYLSIFVIELKTNFYFCLTTCCFVFTSSCLSMLHVLLIAIDRYIAIMFPLRYLSIVTPNTITILIISTWATALFCGLLPLFGWRREAEDLEYCYADLVAPFSYYAMFFCVSFVIPLMMTLGVYWKIILVARSQARRIGQMEASVSRHRDNCSGASEGSNVTRGQAHSNDIDSDLNTNARFESRNSSVAIVKAVKSAAIILGVFVAFWLPSFICRFVLEYLNYGSDKKVRAPLIEAFTNFLAFANSAANPVVYGFRYRDFRKILKKIFKN